MTSSNGNIFRVTGHLCGEFTGPRWIPAQRPVTRSFDVFFDLRLNKRFSKQSWGCWFETLSRPLWRHCNVCITGNPVHSRDPHLVIALSADRLSKTVSYSSPINNFKYVFAEQTTLFKMADDILGYFQTNVCTQRRPLREEWWHSESEIFRPSVIARDLNCLIRCLVSLLKLKSNVYSCKCRQMWLPEIESQYSGDLTLTRWSSNTMLISANHDTIKPRYYMVYYNIILTHWGRDKMATFSQTTLSNAFSLMKILEFRLKFHWSLFLRVQLTIFQHWFR